jgi:hypothetical protein
MTMAARRLASAFTLKWSPRLVPVRKHSPLAAQLQIPPKVE